MDCFLGRIGRFADEDSSENLEILREMVGIVNCNCAYYRHEHTRKKKILTDYTKRRLGSLCFSRLLHSDILPIQTFSVS